MPKRAVKKKPIHKITNTSNNFWGWLLLVLGLVFLLRDAVGFAFDNIWPLILIGAGAYLLWYRK